MTALTQAFTGVLSMSVKAIPVIALIFLLRIPLRRAPRVCSYALWAAAGFRLACPVSVSAAWSLFNLPVLRQSGAQQVAAVLRQTGGEAAAADQNGAASAAQTATGGLNVTALLAVVWLAGMLALLGVALWRLARLRRCVRFAVREQDNIWLCEDIPGPFVMGVLRPRIYLLPSLEGKSRACVLSHEQCHIRRHDPLIQAVAMVLLALHWFNPAVWLAVWGMNRDMELSCDEAAVRHLGEEQREDYSRTLLALGANRRTFGPALAFGAPAVRARILHVLHFRRAGRATVAAALAVVLVAGLTCCTDGSATSWVQGSQPEDGATDAARSYSYSLPDDAENLFVYLDGQEGCAGYSALVDGVLLLEYPQGTFQLDFALTEDNVLQLFLDTEHGSMSGISLGTAETDGETMSQVLPSDAAYTVSVTESKETLRLDQATLIYSLAVTSGGESYGAIDVYLYPTGQSREDAADALLTQSDG